MRRLTVIGLWVCLIVLLSVEFLAISTAKQGDTISEIFWELSSYPPFPFAWGFLMGHFFWQRND
jgi:hypothetical protein